jgi:hypothetical protein
MPTKYSTPFSAGCAIKTRLSVFLPINGSVHTLAEGTVLAFYVPEAKRNEKTVYVDRTPHKAYIRRGGRDDTCTSDELRRFIRDASNTRYDTEPLDVDTSRCFDESSVRWYHARFAASNPGKDTAADDTAFLRTWGFLVEQGGVLRLTIPAKPRSSQQRYVLTDTGGQLKLLCELQQATQHDHPTALVTNKRGSIQ